MCVCVCVCIKSPVLCEHHTVCDVAEYYLLLPAILSFIILYVHLNQQPSPDLNNLKLSSYIFEYCCKECGSFKYTDTIVTQKSNLIMSVIKVCHFISGGNISWLTVPL